MSERSGRFDRPAPRSNWIPRGGKSTASRKLVSLTAHDGVSYAPFDRSRASYWIRLPKSER
jgi:hypothetical protein